MRCDALQGFNSLPDELLVCTFSYLSARDLAKMQLVGSITTRFLLDTYANFGSIIIGVLPF